jgi:preprotein translocase subunit SecG
METIALVLQTLLAITIVVLILIQQGKGAGIGAAFGSGASQTVFGSEGSASALVKVTATLATLFFVSSLGLAWLAKQQAHKASQIGLAAPVAQTKPEPLKTPGDIPTTPSSTSSNQQSSSSDVPKSPATTGSQPTTAKPAESKPAANTASKPAASTKPLAPETQPKAKTESQSK